MSFDAHSSISDPKPALTEDFPTEPQSQSQFGPPLPPPFPNSHGIPDWSSQSMSSRQSESLYSSSSTLYGQVHGTVYARGAAHDERSVTSPTHGGPSDHVLWDNARLQPKQGRNLGGNDHGPPVSVSNTEGLYRATGVDGSVPTRQSLAEGASMLSRQAESLDTRVGNATGVTAQSTTAVSMPGDGFESNIGCLSQVKPYGVSVSEPPRHENNARSVMDTRMMNAKPEQGMRSGPTDFCHGQSYRENNYQPSDLGAAAPEHYLSPSTVISMPANMSMALETSALHSNTTSSQVNAPVKSVYPCTSNAPLQNSLHHFPAPLQSNEQGTHSQAFETGYEDSFPSSRAPQFGLEAASGHTASNPSSLDSRTHQGSMSSSRFDPQQPDHIPRR